MRRGTILVVVLLAACGGDDTPGASGEEVDWLVEVETHGIDARHTATDPVVGGTLLVGDLDEDGLPDVLVGTGSGVRAYRNTGSLAFEERTEGWGLSDVSASAMALARLDDDGRADLVAASSAGLRLLTATGDGFVDATDAAGLGAVSVEQPVHVLPADLDRDGVVDLYVSSYGGADLVLRARGDGAFEDVTERWGMAGESHTWTTSWFDQDGDGAPDLYVATDTFEEDLGDGPEWSEDRRAPGDLLYRNGGWAADGSPLFDEVSAAIRLDTPRSSMGGLVTDLDEDGTLDLFITDFGRNHALSPDPDGTFAYRTEELGLDRAERDDLDGCPPPDEDPTTRCALVSWGAFHRDFDGDGLADLVVVNGGLEPDERGPEPLSAYRGGPDGLEEVRLSTEPVFGRASAVTDLDGDGDPDLIVVEWNGLVRLFDNVTVSARRLLVELEGPAHGRGAGATVRVERPGGARLRAAAPGGLAQSHVHAPLAFSVPSGASRVEVRWASGRVQGMEPPDGASMRIVHPSVVEVDRRVVPADGASEVAVTVRPGDGASTVTVELTGSGETLDAESVGDGTYRATFTAPPSPVRATVIVRIDGEPLGTRPRILFE